MNDKKLIKLLSVYWNAAMLKDMEDFHSWLKAIDRKKN